MSRCMYAVVDFPSPCMQRYAYPLFPLRVFIFRKYQRCLLSSPYRSASTLNSRPQLVLITLNFMPSPHGAHERGCRGGSSRSPAASWCAGGRTLAARRRRGNGNGKLGQPLFVTVRCVSHDGNKTRKSLSLPQHETEETEIQDCPKG